jgi:YD repeat-containing protein
MLSALTLAVLLPLLPVSPIQGQKKSDREAGDLNGPVRSVRTEESTFSGRPGHCSPAPKRLVKLTVYDPYGNLIEYTDYNLDGSVHSKVSFERDPSGYKIEEAYYDGKGRLYRKRFFRPGPDGKLISEESYDPKGLLIARTLPGYRDSGVPAQLDTYDGEGVLIRSRSYDASGNVIEDSHYQNGSLTIRSVGSYDADANKLEESHYKSDGSLYSDSLLNPARIMYSYDTAGRLSQQILYGADGSISWRLSYLYDPKGNIAEQWQYRLGSFLISHRTYRYEYDSAGNWARQTVSEQISDTCSSPIQIVYRTLTYY